MKKIHLQNKTSLQRFGESKQNRLLIKSFFWTCFPPISIDKNGQKDIFNIKSALYRCFNAMKLPFSWRIEMFSKTEPILIKYVWYEINKVPFPQKKINTNVWKIVSLLYGTIRIYEKKRKEENIRNFCFQKPV